jgi:hypothetical protein
MGAIAAGIGGNLVGAVSIAWKAQSSAEGPVIRLAESRIS